MSETTRLRVRVIDAAADPQELDEATARLRAELLDLDVVVSAAEAGQAPEGTRAVLSFTLGGLVVALAGTELLGAIVNAITAWLTRNRHRSVKLDIEGDVLELTGIRSDEQRELVEVWLRRRQGEPSPQAGRRMALIVANDEYRDPGLRRLRAPALDAEALARVLGDEGIGGFDVRTMLNESTAVINEAVEEFFADRHPDDLLLLHFSGHGVKDDSGELYFATPSTKLNRLGATAVAAEFVNRRMNRSRCRRIVLLLDCCYAGAFARGAMPRAGTDLHVEDQFGGRGRVVITASNALEYAFDGPDLADTRDTSPSVFTSALVEGLETGEADRDQDGYVGIHELYDYVFDRVRTVTPNQTPGKWTFDVQGDLVIARRGRPVDRPAPLPPELQEAIDHPIATIRAGTVDELARLRRSRHAGLALAARLALEGLADDDSRMVSAAATRALGTDAPAPDPALPLSPPPPADPTPRPAPLATPQTSIPSPLATPQTSIPSPLAVSQPAAPAPAPITEAAAPHPTSDSAQTPSEEAPLPAAGPPAIRAWSAWTARTMRAVALISALVLTFTTPQGLFFADRFSSVQGDYVLWPWALIAATLALGLLPDGRARQATLGAAAGLAVLHLGVFVYLIDHMGERVGLIVSAVVCALVLLTVLVELALAEDGWWRAVWAGAGALTLVVIFVNIRYASDVDEDPGETVPWIVVFSLAVVLAVALIARTVLLVRAGRGRAKIVLNAAAALLLAVAVCSLYATGSSDYDEIPISMPALLVLLLVTAQAVRDRPELLAAAQFAVIAGFLHGFPTRVPQTAFVVLMFAAAACAVAGFMLASRARPRT
ncbi:caspase domain-containing protein [Nonomuraea purpurea]|uniref:Caspase domain-containing protein n=1 Tax=Nonomuraea purpurea TaxID=1849276 RepID=A0ABV8GQI5_9ACTN